MQQHKTETHTTQQIKKTKKKKERQDEKGRLFSST